MKKLLKKDLIKQTSKQTLIGLKTNLPIFLGVLLLIAIIQQYIPFSSLTHIKNNFISSIVVNILGSISAGNPINSYIIANEFGPIKTEGFMIAIFLISWITVGFIQIPAESFFFGKKYALVRNILAFFSSFIIGYLIYIIYIKF